VNLTETPILIPPVASDNVTDLLEQRVAATPDRVLFATPNGDGWNDMTAAEFRSRVIGVAKGFAATGVQPGDRIGFMCKTSFEWSLVDFALFYAGAVMVPIYETSSALQVQWILEDSGARGIITETAEHAARFDEIRSEAAGVDHVWRLDEGALRALTESGAEVADDEIERRRNIANGDDTATLIYTSGSTGRPKGCVLTHSNFVDLSRNAAAALGNVVNEPGASTLLFVTLAHVFARFISVLAVHAGVRVGHQPDTTKLLPSLGSFQPSFLLAVPRVFEKIYNSLDAKATTEGKGRIFTMAAATSISYSRALDGRMSPLLRARHKLFDVLVYSKLRAALGGQCAFAISGGAPLGERLGHFYRGAGVTILEGYGLTETTAPTNVNTPSFTTIGTVGQPLPGTSTRLADDGELLIKGVGVFRGYFNNPTATAEAFTADGFYRSGDLCSIKMIGGEPHIVFQGRLKDVVNRGGEKINCLEVELIAVGHPKVASISIIPVPDPGYGERACAFVIPAPGVTELSPKELGVFLEERGLAKFKWPEFVELISEFPVTSAGKISKPHLREIALERAKARGQHATEGVS